MEFMTKDYIGDNQKEQIDFIQSTIDFTSIITSFCARIYGKRRSKRKSTKMIGELNENNSD